MLVKSMNRGGREEWLESIRCSGFVRSFHHRGHRGRKERTARSSAFSRFLCALCGSSSCQREPLPRRAQRNAEGYLGSDSDPTILPVLVPHHSLQRLPRRISRELGKDRDVANL